VQKRLFEDEYRVFYDAVRAPAPQSEADYLAADHATVVYEPRRSLDLDQHLAARGVQRRFTVMVPGFAGLPPFLRGSELLATPAHQWLRATAGCVARSRYAPGATGLQRAASR
jgi:hypothetical protein